MDILEFKVSLDKYEIEVVARNMLGYLINELNSKSKKDVGIEQFKHLYDKDLDVFKGLCAVLNRLDRYIYLIEAIESKYRRKR